MIKRTDNQNPICGGNLFLNVDHTWHNFFVKIFLGYYSIPAFVVF